jgi:hypothetical protein
MAIIDCFLTTQDLKARHNQALHLPLDKLSIHCLQVFVQQFRKARAQVEGLLSNQM